MAAWLNTWYGKQAERRQWRCRGWTISSRPGVPSRTKFSSRSWASTTRGHRTWRSCGHRADHAELKDLAVQIIQAQTQEIAQMKGWEKAWFSRRGKNPTNRFLRQVSVPSPQKASAQTMFRGISSSRTAWRAPASTSVVGRHQPRLQRSRSQRWFSFTVHSAIFQLGSRRYGFLPEYRVIAVTDPLRGFKRIRGMSGVLANTPTLVDAACRR